MRRLGTETTANGKHPRVGATSHGTCCALRRVSSSVTRWHAWRQAVSCALGLAVAPHSTCASARAHLSFFRGAAVYHAGSASACARRRCGKAVRSEPVPGGGGREAASCYLARSAGWTLVSGSRFRVVLCVDSSDGARILLGWRSLCRLLQRSPVPHHLYGGGAARLRVPGGTTLALLVRRFGTSRYNTRDGVS